MGRNHAAVSTEVLGILGSEHIPNYYAGTNP